MDKEQQALLDAANNAPIEVVQQDSRITNSYDYFKAQYIDTGVPESQAHEWAMQDCESLEWS